MEVDGLNQETHHNLVGLRAMFIRMTGITPDIGYALPCDWEANGLDRAMKALGYDWHIESIGRIGRYQNLDVVGRYYELRRNTDDYLAAKYLAAMSALDNAKRSHRI